VPGRLTGRAELAGVEGPGQRPGWWVRDVQRVVEWCADGCSADSFQAQAAFDCNHAHQSACAPRLRQELATCDLLPSRTCSVPDPAGSLALELARFPKLFRRLTDSISRRQVG
jgi:hypothetical protein